VPILVGCGQFDAAEATLRKFVETAFLCLYFTDHPVEWTEFQKNPGAGISRETTTPIANNAHREPSFYANYARELLAGEPSGLAVAAAGRLIVAYGRLSQAVHAAAASVNKHLGTAHDAIDEQSIGRFGETYRRCVADVAIVVAARLCRRFDSLPPVHRAWFDWLVGSETKKRLRAGPFGLDPPR